MTVERKPLSDKELWRGLAAAIPAARVAVSELDLAAWLEGRLGEAAAARIEAALDADAELRHAAFELADILGKPLPVPPPRMAVRAQALVGFEAEREGIRGGRLMGRLFSLGATFAIPRAAMATAAVLIAISGFMMGGGLGESLAKERFVVASNQSTDSSNELTAFFGTDGI